MNIIIKDENKLISIFKAIAWLDEKRWGIEENYDVIKFPESFTNCEKILTHWICYITNRQMPFESVWEQGGKVLSHILYEYSRNKSLPQAILDEHYKGELDDKGNKRFKFSSINDTYASRYVTDDYQSIKQTLEFLDDPKYQRNIIAYILDIIRRYKDKDDLLIRVACGLHLMTYQLYKKKADYKKALAIVNDSDKFEENLSDFTKTSTTGKKRLWCCIRDYKKGPYYKIFKEATKETASYEEGLINIWDNLPMNQLELPGDVWNNKPIFKDNIFAKVVAFDFSNEEAPKIIRELYKRLRGSEEMLSYYPEQFDITFDFVPRMCSKKLCKICLFGENGIEKICIPAYDKYCPVALISCGYIVDCIESKCILKENFAKGICKEI